jgi:hypothetical protein
MNTSVDSPLDTESSSFLITPSPLHAQQQHKKHISLWPYIPPQLLSMTSHPIPDLDSWLEEPAILRLWYLLMRIQ